MDGFDPEEIRRGLDSPYTPPQRRLSDEDLGRVAQIESQLEDLQFQLLLAQTPERIAQIGERRQALDAELLALWIGEGPEDRQPSDD